MQSNNVDRKLTQNPKLGLLGWGLAGGFVMGTGMPGAILGTSGVALFFLGAVKSLAQGVLPLALLFLVVSALLISAGYMRYSSAYDGAAADPEEKRGGEPG